MKGFLFSHSHIRTHTLFVSFWLFLFCNFIRNIVKFTCNKLFALFNTKHNEKNAIVRCFYPHTHTMHTNQNEWKHKSLEMNFFSRFFHSIVYYWYVDFFFIKWLDFVSVALVVCVQLCIVYSINKRHQLYVKYDSLHFVSLSIIGIERHLSVCVTTAAAAAAAYSAGTMRTFTVLSIAITNNSIDFDIISCDLHAITMRN